MRITKYRMEYDRHDGYMILNAGLDEDSIPAIPAKTNLNHPSIRVVNVVKDITDCVEISDGGLYKIPKSFRKNYKKALLGQSAEWIFYCVHITKRAVSLRFVSRKTGLEESLFIVPPNHARFCFEVDREDGSTERYLLSISRTEKCDEPCNITLTEHYSYGRRVLTFSRGLNCVEQCQHPSWEYVYITEYSYLT